MDREHYQARQRASYQRRKRRRQDSDQRRNDVSDSEPSEDASADEDYDNGGDEHSAGNQAPVELADEIQDNDASDSNGTSADENNDEEMQPSDDGEGHDPETDSDDLGSNSSSDESSEDEGSLQESEGEAEESEREESEDVSSEDENADENERNKPIYPGASISLLESMLSIFTLMSCQHLSGKVMSLILQLICLHCPDGSLVKKTLHTFKKFFSRLGEALFVYHFYCSNCIYPLKLKTSVCKKCKKSGNVSFFLELPLLHQLQNLFLRDKFYDDLQFRFRASRKRHPDHIEDIYDGNLYKEDEFFQNPSNISFMWYSDGIKIFKSSTVSLWPLCLVINELPYKQRTLPANILLVGLWFGKGKPSPNVFLKPLEKTMKKFEQDGHKFKLCDNSEVTVRGKIICGTCDLPAKSKFLQFMQFNGTFGCCRCLEPGGRVQVGRTTVQAYPYRANFVNRTHEQTKASAQEALEARKRNKKAHVQGVKGPTLLARIVPDIIRCTAIDIMHGVFSGVCKMLLSLWFDSKFSKMPWTLHHSIDLVEEKLCKIKSPSFVQRAPRSLKELKFWKASEFKLFLMYYSVPVLRGIMDEVYFKHHCRLVSGIYLLSQDSISLDQVKAATALLSSYVSDFARLYSIRFLGINVHQLLHLGDLVLDLGPLWVYSCFFLESFNGVLGKCFHGTQHVALQISSAVSMFLQVPLLMKALPADSRIHRFCNVTQNSFKAFKVADVIDEVTFAVGTYSQKFCQKVNHSKQILRQSMNIVNGRCNIFLRLRKKGIMYFSEEYGFISKRKESSYISFLQDVGTSIGRILRFVKWSGCGNLCDVDCSNCPSNYFVIVRTFERQVWFAHEMPNIRLSYMFKVYDTGNVVAVPVQSIISLCFYIEANGEKYIACPINRLEVE